MGLRDYQIPAATKCVENIKKYGLTYLCGEVRVGKTFISLQVMDDLGKEEVLFVTKKKAISSIMKDYTDGEFSFEITIINYESLHKLNGRYDGIILDESHCFGKMPKPSQRATRLKSIVGATDTLFMSGSPNPESYSQLYHQFWVHDNSPWKNFKNFYAWVNYGYVYKYTKAINGMQLNFYDRGNESKILGDANSYMVKLSQEDAGFDCPVTEHFHYVSMREKTYDVIKTLKADQVVKIGDKDIVIETPAKALMKFRQLYSGTVKFEDGTTETIDLTKVEYIKKNFAGKKIAIYYCFIQEGKLLREQFANFTDDPMEFNQRDDLVFICQMVSGREGINLSTADALVMYNIDYSATTYFQVRARLQDKNRMTPALVHWVFAKDGIEGMIYKAVSKKKNYTVKYFLRDFGINFKTA